MKIPLRKDRIALGSFKTLEAAVEAYNKAAEFHFGEFSLRSEIPHPAGKNP